jgi:hypothetical protein
MRKSKITLRTRAAIFLAFVFCLVGLVEAQNSQQNRTLIVAGHSGELAVVEMNGRTYVEVEGLARLANGSLTFRGTQIVLTLPAQDSHSQIHTSDVNRSSGSEFSKDFLEAGIEEMGAIREWRTALMSAVRQGTPVTEDWVGTFRNRAQQSLRLVSISATTDSDREALQLLTNEFNNMNQLSERFLAANRSLAYMPTNSLDNDPLNERILACAHSLAAMAGSGQFLDDGSCH